MINLKLASNRVSAFESPGCLRELPSLAAEMALGQNEIGERIWALGIEAGFDRDGYRRVLEQVFNAY